MRFILMLLSVLFVAVGCTKQQTNEVACQVQDSVTSIASATVASQLACKNLDAVKASIDKEMAKLNLCKPDSASLAVGELVCAPVVNALAAGLLGAIPANWECTGGATVEDLKAKVLEACKKAL